MNVTLTMVHLICKYPAKCAYGHVLPITSGIVHNKIHNKDK